MNRGLLTLTLALAGVTATAASGPDRYRDYASVVKVEPIVEGIPVGGSRRGCDASLHSGASVIAARIGEDIRSQIRRWDDRPGCRPERERAYPGRVVGYWVTYDYGGRTGVRRLSYDPGPWVPVTVRLTPLR